MKMLKGKKGFTLIELVIVIAILGILAGLAIPRFLDATASARGSRIIADLRTIDSAIVIYNAKTGDIATKSEQLTATTSGNYQLLASWPVAPTGKAVITVDGGGQYEWTPKTTTYAIKDGRATLDGDNASVLLAKGKK